MTLKATFLKVSAFILAVICCLVLAGCNSKYGFTGGTAATVNGTPIEEDTVTKYIEDFRTSSNLTEEEAWANWLKESSQDPASVRSQVVDYYVQQELIRQAADENEVVIEQSQIDEQVDAMKKNYSNDKAWQDALAQSGVTEDQYRDSIKIGLTSRALQDKVITEVDTSDDAGLLEFMNQYKDMINGSKRSSHILFAADDAAKAEEVVGMLTSGQIDFATAAQQYSTDTGSARNGGDVGWNTINNYVDAYNQALDSIEEVFMLSSAPMFSTLKVIRLLFLPILQRSLTTCVKFTDHKRKPKISKSGLITTRKNLRLLLMKCPPMFPITSI